MMSRGACILHRACACTEGMQGQARPEEERVAVLAASSGVVGVVRAWQRAV